MDDGEFRRGDIDIQWLERRLQSLLAVMPPPALVRDAAIAAALVADRDRVRLRTDGGRSGAATSGTGATADRARDSAWQRTARLDALR
jgi:hypothetical protein